MLDDYLLGTSNENKDNIAEFPYKILAAGEYSDGVPSHVLEASIPEIQHRQQQFCHDQGNQEIERKLEKL